MDIRTRVLKAISRCNEKYDERTHEYINWIYSRPGKTMLYASNYDGTNRMFTYKEAAGYVGRKHQIEKCFTKGWYAENEH